MKEEGASNEIHRKLFKASQLQIINDFTIEKVAIENAYSEWVKRCPMTDHYSELHVLNT